MALKQIQWKFFTFYYFEQSDESWWAFFPFLRFCGLSGYPKQILSKPLFSQWPTKTFGDFETEYKIFPKQTLFLSQTNVIEFLLFWAKNSESQEVHALISAIQSSSGKIVTSPTFKKPRRKDFSFLERKILALPLAVPTSEQTELLSNYVKEQVEMASLAQSYVVSQQLVSGLDVLRIFFNAKSMVTTAQNLSNITNQPLYVTNFNGNEAKTVSPASDEN